MIAEISNRKRNTYKFQDKLRALGMAFNYDDKKWYIDTDDDAQLKKIRRFARWHNLYCLVYPPESARSIDYRYEYFKNNPPGADGRYVCAYCFKKMYPEEAQIDHIIPVNLAKRSRSARWVMRKLGFASVNDMRNLTTACPECNRKKSAKGGIWVIRGFLGKTKWFPVLYKIACITLAGGIVIFMLSLVF